MSGDRTAGAADPLKITDAIEIDERDIEERFVRASGPGGSAASRTLNRSSTARR